MRARRRDEHRSRPLACAVRAGPYWRPAGAVTGARAMDGAGGGYSITALYARVAGPVLRWWEGSVIGAPEPAADLSDADRTALQDRLTPAVERLLVLRDEAVAELDEKTRVAVPGAAGVALLAVWLTSGSLILGLLIGAAAAVGVFNIVALGPATRHDADVRRTFGPDIADYLTGFSYETEGFFRPGRLDRWKLFPRVEQPLWLDRMEGTRDGRAVSLYRLSVTHSGSAGQRQRQNQRLEGVCVEFACAPVASDVVILLPLWVRGPLAGGPAGHGLRPVDIGWDDLGRRYTVHAARREDAEALLTPARCAEIRQMAGQHAAINQERVPILLFLPDRMVAIYTLSSGLPLFRPPPLWDDFYADEVLEAFVSDLAFRQGLMLDLLPIAPPPAGKGDA